MGPDGPLWALMGPLGQVLAGPDMSDFQLLVEFCMLRVQNWVLTKCLDDSAWLLPEKLKNHIILTKSLDILPTILKILQKSLKIQKK